MEMQMDEEPERGVAATPTRPDYELVIKTDFFLDVDGKPVNFAAHAVVSDAAKIQAIENSQKAVNVMRRATPRPAEG